VPNAVLLRDWLAEEARRHGTTVARETDRFMRAVMELEREEHPVTQDAPTPPENPEVAATVALPQWRCPACQTTQSADHFAGWDGIHWCLACGYIGGGGTTTS
jgi:hypothetical protein